MLIDQTARDATSAALQGIKMISGLLDVYSGQNLAKMYADQEKTGDLLIVGAQPLVLPPIPGFKEAMERLPEEERYFQVSSGVVLVGWWYTKTVTQFDLDMLGELFDTDDSELMISLEQCCKFLGSPVLIPFEKPYHDDGADILGCIVGFATDDPIDFNGLNSFVFLPVFIDSETELPNFSVGLARFNTRD